MTQQQEGPAGGRSAGDADPSEEPQGNADTGAREDSGQAGGQGPHEELLLTLQDARERADAHWNELLRARADLANVQRRAERDIENAYKYGLEKFVAELLPVIDSLELGLDAASDAPDKLREGTELTLKMLTSATAKFGVQVVDPRPGEKFDPALHQAMSVRPAEPGMEPNQVIAVYQKGYVLNDRLVRPAMVVVSGAAGKKADKEAVPEGGAGPGGRIDEMA